MRPEASAQGEGQTGCWWSIEWIPSRPFERNRRSLSVLGAFGASRGGLRRVPRPPVPGTAAQGVQQPWPALSVSSDNPLRLAIDEVVHHDDVAPCVVVGSRGHRLSGCGRTRRVRPRTARQQRRSSPRLPTPARPRGKGDCRRRRRTAGRSRRCFPICRAADRRPKKSRRMPSSSPGLRHRPVKNCAIVTFESRRLNSRTGRNAFEVFEYERVAYQRSCQYDQRRWQEAVLLNSLRSPRGD